MNGAYIGELKWVPLMGANASTEAQDFEEITEDMFTNVITFENLKEKRWVDMRTYVDVVEPGVVLYSTDSKTFAQYVDINTPLMLSTLNGKTAILFDGELTEMIRDDANAIQTGFESFKEFFGEMKEADGDNYEAFFKVYMETNKAGKWWEVGNKIEEFKLGDLYADLMSPSLNLEKYDSLMYKDVGENEWLRLRDPEFKAIGPNFVRDALKNFALIYLEDEALSNFLSRLPKEEQRPHVQEIVAKVKAFQTEVAKKWTEFVDAFFAKQEVTDLLENKQPTEDNDILMNDLERDDNGLFVHPCGYVTHQLRVGHQAQGTFADAIDKIHTIKESGYSFIFGLYHHVASQFYLNGGVLKGLEKCSHIDHFALGSFKRLEKSWVNNSALKFAFSRVMTRLLVLLFKNTTHFHMNTKYYALIKEPLAKAFNGIVEECSSILKGSASIQDEDITSLVQTVAMGFDDIVLRQDARVHSFIANFTANVSRNMAEMVMKTKDLMDRLTFYLQNEPVKQFDYQKIEAYFLKFSDKAMSSTSNDLPKDLSDVQPFIPEDRRLLVI